MLRVVVLVSGGGTNLQAIIDAVENGTITNTEIVGVISNNKNAYALERAKAKDIPVLGRIPFEPKLAAACDAGMIELFDGDWLKEAEKVLEKLASEE